MYINPKIGGISRPDLVQPTAPDQRTPTPASPAPAVPAQPRSDSVRISDAGRALATRTDSRRTEGLTPERAAEIRERVMHGAYDSLAVVDEVARRILDRGDLTPTA